MVIIALIYGALVWLVAFRKNWLRGAWLSGPAAILDRRTSRAPLTIAASLYALSAMSLPLLAENEPPALTPDQRAIIDQIAKSSNGESVHYAGAPTDPIGAEVRLPFREGKYITLVRRGSAAQKDGSVSWHGEVQETGERAVLMLWSNALLTGYFAYKGTIFTVESLGGGVHAFAEMDRGKLPADHPPRRPRATASRRRTPSSRRRRAQRLPSRRLRRFRDAERQALEAKNITIDLMVLYTKNVAKRYIRDPADLLALAIEETNETFRNSGLGNINLRLVHSEAIDYDGTVDDQFTHLYTMVDGLGPFKDVKKLRDEKRADIVGLIIDNPNGCGLSTRIGAESDEAFFVVHHACATITMSIAHEIGHILGARHDRFIDESDVPFAYGHGYVNGSQMARHHELQGRLRRLPAHTLLVES